MGDKGNRRKQIFNPLTGNFDTINEYDNLVINYIPKFTMEQGNPGFAGYNDGAVEVPIDGDGGFIPGTLAINISTDLNDKLRGNASLCIEKPAGSFQGQGFAMPFTIDPIDQGKSIKFECDFRNTVNFAEGDLGLYFYDIDNSRLIYPSNIIFPDSGQVVGQTFRADFPASIDSTNYRVIFHIKTTNALAWDFCFDHLFIGPFKNSSNTTGFDSEWEDDTCDGSFTSNTTYFCKFRRDGSDAIIQYKAQYSGVPAPAVALQFNLPSKIPGVDVSKLLFDVNQVADVFSSGFHLDNGSARFGVNALWSGINNNFTVVFDDTVATGTRRSSVTPSNPFGIVSGDETILTVRVPVLGWGNGVKANEIISGAPQVARLDRANAITLPDNSFQKLTFTSGDVTRDTFNGYDAGLDAVVIRESGDYDMNCFMSLIDNPFVGRNLIVRFLKNGSPFPFGTDVENTSAGNTYTVKNTIIAEPLVAGDIIELEGYQNDTFGATSEDTVSYGFTLAKRNDLNSRLNPDDTPVVLRASSDSGQAIAASPTNTDLIHEDIERDSHGIYNPLTGETTISKPGDYLGVVSFENVSVAWGTNNSITLDFYVNGVAVQSRFERVEVANSKSFCFQTIAFLEGLVPGDVITAKIRPSVAMTLSANPQRNNISIREMR